MNQVKNSPSQQFLGLEAKNVAIIRAQVGEANLRIGLTDEIGRVFHELAEPFFTFPQGGFGSNSWSNVAIIEHDGAHRRIVESINANAFDVPPGSVLMRISKLRMNVFSRVAPAIVQ